MKTTAMVLLIVCGSVLAVACETLEQQRAREEQQRAREEAFMNSLKDRCKGYGYKEETDVFANCVRDEARAAEARHQDDIRAREARAREAKEEAKEEARAREARAHAEEARKNRQYRESMCSAGLDEYCDNSPQRGQ